MLQATFSPQGFMAAVETGLLQYVAPGHFHWKALLKQRFLYQATLAVRCFQVLQCERARRRAFFCVAFPRLVQRRGPDALRDYSARAAVHRGRAPVRWPLRQGLVPP